MVHLHSLGGQKIDFKCLCGSECTGCNGQIFANPLAIMTEVAKNKQKNVYTGLRD